MGRRDESLCQSLRQPRRHAKDEAKQKRAVAELKKLLAAEADPDEVKARADLTVADLREEFGLEKPKILMPGLDLERRRRAHLPGDRASARLGARARTGSYARLRRQVQATRGEITDQLVAAFHKKYEKRLSEAERDAPVQWIRSSAS